MKRAEFVDVAVLLFIKRPTKCGDIPKTNHFQKYTKCSHQLKNKQIAFVIRLKTTTSRFLYSLINILYHECYEYLYDLKRDLFNIMPFLNSFCVSASQIRRWIKDIYRSTYYLKNSVYYLRLTLMNARNV